MAEGERPVKRVHSVMEDPSARAVARVYATALLDASAGVGVASTLEELGSFLSDVLDAHPGFADLLGSVAVGRDQKLAMIDRVVGPVGTPLFTSFLKTLARHDRLELLPLILDEAHRIDDRRSGRKRVEVTTATPLDPTVLESIRQRIDAAFTFSPILDPRIDPSLIGGMVIQVENTVYDSSLRTRMKQLRDRLRERSLHEIQSGRDRFSHPEGD
ncbi:MAG: ATP synthase F1 subunit delta [Planctomycetaceae bacterium]|jgi:F-type H+-transporting ATPase subunit delta|nr:ATP synthase F1 subunit delta [Planctomycetaceae bacterium]MDP7278100.1 ATP synthase F1 subunit delta [Planctomycetaceae bacterium]